MSGRNIKRMQRVMREFVREEYRKELSGMCNYPFWRRVRIALRIILGNTEK
jgi:hypothetical protein